MSLYLFKIRKPRGAPKPDGSTPQLDEIDPVAEPEMQPVNGIMPDSKEEWRSILALDYLKLGYQFHYAMFGGRNRTGGAEIDILAETVPLKTPIFINGAYWHKKDDFKQNLQVSRINKLGYFRRAIIVWDYEIPTLTQAIQVYKERLRL